VDGFDKVPFNDVEAVRRAVGPSTCAVLVEPIQGEGGVRVPDGQYLCELSALCREAGILLILDEVQTGMGRTGKLFAHEHFEMEPDIMTLAKGLANGLPIGAMLATEKVAQSFGPGSHATTFGGGPVVTAAALAVVRAMERDAILGHCRTVGQYFKGRLEALREKHSCVAEIRGLGLLLGMALTVEGAPVVEACRAKGFLINCTQGNVLRFIPPLIVGEWEIDSLVTALDAILGGLETG